ncbi:hypothetical protein N9L19_00140 [bacterium]|nr:hypothetical protein [bacterium]
MRPLSELKADFRRLWEYEVETAGGRGTGPYGRGRPVLFPGAKTLLEGAWEQLLVFGRVAGHILVVVWQMDRGMFLPDELVEQFTAVIESRLAPGMDIYGLKHLCHGMAHFLQGTVEAYNERMHKDAANNLRSNSPVEPGRLQYLATKLVCSDDAPRPASARKLKDSSQMRALRDAVDRELETGTTRAACRLRAALKVTGRHLPYMFDFQVLLCSLPMMEFAWPENIAATARLDSRWRITTDRFPGLWEACLASGVNVIS